MLACVGSIMLKYKAAAKVVMRVKRFCAGLLIVNELVKCTGLVLAGFFLVYCWLSGGLLLKCCWFLLSNSRVVPVW